MVGMRGSMPNKEESSTGEGPQSGPPNNSSSSSSSPVTVSSSSPVAVSSSSSSPVAVSSSSPASAEAPFQLLHPSNSSSSLDSSQEENLFTQREPQHQQPPNFSSSSSSSPADEDDGGELPVAISDDTSTENEASSGSKKSESASDTSLVAASTHKKLATSTHKKRNQVSGTGTRFSSHSVQVDQQQQQQQKHGPPQRQQQQQGPQQRRDGGETILAELKVDHDGKQCTLFVVEGSVASSAIGIQESSTTILSKLKVDHDGKQCTLFVVEGSVAPAASGIQESSTSSRRSSRPKRKVAFNGSCKQVEEENDEANTNQTAAGSVHVEGNGGDDPTQSPPKKRKVHTADYYVYTSLSKEEEFSVRKRHLELSKKALEEDGDIEKIPLLHIFLSLSFTDAEQMLNLAENESLQPLTQLRPTTKPTLPVSNPYKKRGTMKPASGRLGKDDSVRKLASSNGNGDSSVASSRDNDSIECDGAGAGDSSATTRLVRQAIEPIAVSDAKTNKQSNRSKRNRDDSDDESDDESDDDCDYEDKPGPPKKARRGPPKKARRGRPKEDQDYDEDQDHDASIQVTASGSDDAIKEPHEHDVLCGRGPFTTSWKGNKRFRTLVEKKIRVFLAARFLAEKQQIYSSIVQEIQSLDPPGRFLSKNAKKGTWFVIDDGKARKKVSMVMYRVFKAFKEKSATIGAENETEINEQRAEIQSSQHEPHHPVPPPHNGGNTPTNSHPACDGNDDKQPTKPTLRMKYDAWFDQQFKYLKAFQDNKNAEKGTINRFYIPVGPHANPKARKIMNKLNMDATLGLLSEEQLTKLKGINFVHEELDKEAALAEKSRLQAMKRNEIFDQQFKDLKAFQDNKNAEKGTINRFYIPVWPHANPKARAIMNKLNMDATLGLLSEEQLTKLKGINFVHEELDKEAALAVKSRRQAHGRTSNHKGQETDPRKQVHENISNAKFEEDPDDAIWNKIVASNGIGQQAYSFGATHSGPVMKATPWQEGGAVFHATKETIDGMAMIPPEDCGLPKGTAMPEDRKVIFPGSLLSIPGKSYQRLPYDGNKKGERNDDLVENLPTLRPKDKRSHWEDNVCGQLTIGGSVSFQYRHSSSSLVSSNVFRLFYWTKNNPYRDNFIQYTQRNEKAKEGRDGKISENQKGNKSRFVMTKDRATVPNGCYRLEYDLQGNFVKKEKLYHHDDVEMLG